MSARVRPRTLPGIRASIAFARPWRRARSRFRARVPTNGLTIDGGRTLAYELADAEVSLDTLVVQVGGGALASAVAQGLHEAVALGRLPREPVMHVVQPEVNAPLVRAWERARAAAEEAPRTRRDASP